MNCSDKFCFQNRILFPNYKNPNDTLNIESASVTDLWLTQVVRFSYLSVSVVACPFLYRTYTNTLPLTFYSWRQSIVFSSWLFVFFPPVLCCFYFVLLLGLDSSGLEGVSEISWLKCPQILMMLKDYPRIVGILSQSLLYERL